MPAAGAPMRHPIPFKVAAPADFAAGVAREIGLPAELLVRLRAVGRRLCPATTNRNASQPERPERNGRGGKAGGGSDLVLNLSETNRGLRTTLGPQLPSGVPACLHQATTPTTAVGTPSPASSPTYKYMSIPACSEARRKASQLCRTD